jgi:hypothetical protein
MMMGFAAQMRMAVQMNTKLKSIENGLKER